MGTIKLRSDAHLQPWSISGESVLGITGNLKRLFGFGSKAETRQSAPKEEGGPTDSVTLATPEPKPAIIRRKATGIAAEYRDNFDFQDDMKALAQKHPEHVKLFELGKSVQGRVISGMSIGTGPIGLVVTGMMHGCEWTGGEAAFELGKKIAEQRPDLMDKVTLHVVPVSNPDAQEVSRGVLHGYRANVNGVDPNRNWPTNWGTNEITPQKFCHEIGGTGEAPLSEPETQAINKLTGEEYKTKGWLDLHSYGEFFVHPKSERPEKYEALIADMQKTTSKPYDSMKIQDHQDITGSLAEHCESLGIIAVGAELGTKHQPKGEEREATIQDGVNLGMAFVEHLAKS